MRTRPRTRAYTLGHSDTLVRGAAGGGHTTGRRQLLIRSLATVQPARMMSLAAILEKSATLAAPSSYGTQHVNGDRGLEALSAHFITPRDLLAAQCWTARAPVPTQGKEAVRPETGHFLVQGRVCMRDANFAVTRFRVRELNLAPTPRPILQSVLPCRVRIFISKT